MSLPYDLRLTNNYFTDQWHRFWVLKDGQYITFTLGKGTLLHSIKVADTIPAGRAVTLAINGVGYSPYHTSMRFSQVYFRTIASQACTNLNFLTSTEVVDAASQKCDTVPGDCNSLSQGSSCHLEFYRQMLAEEKIASETFNDLTKSLDGKLMYCNGLDDGILSVDVDSIRQSGYDDGFSAGVQSIDQEAIRKEGFDAGVASIDQEAIQKEAFDAGAASVPVESIKSEAYQSGFDAGAASIQCPVDGGGSDKEKNKKVTICHNANGKGRTIEVSMKALQAHLNHGDTEGACANVDSSKKVKSKKN